MCCVDVHDSHMDDFVVKQVVALEDAHNVDGLRAGDEHLKKCESSFAENKLFLFFNARTRQRDLLKLCKTMKFQMLNNCTRKSGFSSDVVLQ